MTPEHIALFDARPPLPGAPCAACRGRGRVPAGSYWLAPDREFPSDNSEAIPTITAIPVGSCSIFEATNEAAEIAQRGEVIVVFGFNGRLVVVRPDSDPRLVARRWWTEEYGKTPEQSAAER